MKRDPDQSRVSCLHPWWIRFAVGGMVLLVSFCSCYAQFAGRPVSADAMEIDYMGRVLKKEDGAVSLDWPGTSIRFDLQGSWCAMRVSDTGTSYYHVFVDDSLHRIIQVVGRDTLIVLVDGLENKRHSIRLQKRSEAQFGRTRIFSFLPGEGGKLFATRGRKTRHIEFIGDSFTCGYGTDGSHRDESFSVETENADKTYACILSRYFDADYTLLAHSGRGAVRNYGDAVRVSHYTMKDAVKFVLDTDTSQRYIASHKPDLVVVFLGTNDFSTQPEPKRAEFKKGYGQLLTWLREQYGEVPILCVIPAVGERVEGYIRELVAERQDNRLVHTASLRNVINDTTDLGAGWHPGYLGHQKMAMFLLPYVSTLMDWPLTERHVK